MAEIKFRCPECTQKIAVRETAAGLRIDCPSCRSRLVIPRAELAPVDVLVKRRLSVVGESAEAVYMELQKAQAAAEKSADELARARAERGQALEQARADAAQAHAERDSLAAEVIALKPLKDQLADVQKELADVRQQTLATARENESRLGQAKKSESAMRADLTALRATHAEMEGKLAAGMSSFAAIQQERDSLLAKAAASADLGRQLDDIRRELERAKEESDAAAREYQGQVEHARVSEGSLKAEIDVLRGKLADAESRLTNQTRQFDELHQQFAELEASAANLQPLHEQLSSAERLVAQGELKVAEAIRDRDAVIQGAKTAEAAMAAKLAEAERRIAAFNHGFSALKHEREEIDARVANSAKTAEADLATAREEAQRLRSQLEETGRLLDAARLEREHAIETTAERQKTIDKLSASMAAGKAELTQLREKLNSDAREQGRLNAAIEKATHGGAELQERLKRSEAQAGMRKQEAENIKALLDAAQAAGRAKENEIHQLGIKIETLTAHVAEKEKAAREALDQAGQYRAKYVEAVERAGNARRAAGPPAKDAAGGGDERMRFAAELARKSAELDAIKEELSKTRAEHGSARTGGAPGDGSSQGREKALEAERDALRAELDGVKSALERAKQHVGVLQSRRDLLRDEIATLRARLGAGTKVSAAGGKPGAT